MVNKREKVNGVVLLDFMPRQKCLGGLKYLQTVQYYFHMKSWFCVCRDQNLSLFVVFLAGDLALEDSETLPHGMFT